MEQLRHKLAIDLREHPGVRLSQIRTNWSQLFAATQANSEATNEAQRELLINYSGAVFRYLLGAVRNEHVASDLAQDFAVRFLRGDFKTVVPEKGRFRDFLKRTLSNLVFQVNRRATPGFVKTSAVLEKSLLRCCEPKWQRP